ncbi:hypothetical protein [Streptomyces sp. HD]|uniref:hypothetical protein n=1 Tax=Streptomyces sp. HD TaxID=3020892 RepID=UPI00232C3A01|nr:hypothetical protein [Streptomyces sp. HD]MDC0769190.1 hypothetical protein [Streptomyces sp. HD]
MNTQPRPPLKSLTHTPTRPGAAELAAVRTAVGEPKGAARKGVRTALRPDPQTGDGRYPIAWLHICAPYEATPTATSKCQCGRDRSAVGHGKVLALIADHEGHRDLCPLRTPQEERAAA